MRKILFTALTALVALVSAAAATAQTPSRWPAGEMADSYFGTRVPDPYRELENVRDPAVQRWMREQADSSAKLLARIPGRHALIERIRAIDADTGGSVQNIERCTGGRLFFTRRNPGEQQFKLVWRDGPAGSDHVIVDPDALSKAAGRPVAIMDFAPSPDGKKLAYSLQSGGGEIGVLHVVDVASGRALAEPLDRIRYAGVSWLEDGSGFFYRRLKPGFESLPATQKFQDHGSYFHVLEGPLKGNDRLIFSASHLPELGLPSIASARLSAIPGTPWVAARVALGVERNQLLFVADLKDATEGRARWRQVVGVQDQVSQIAVASGYFYLRSAKGAARYQVLRLPVGKPDLADAEVVVPESDGVIASIGAASDALYFTRRTGVQTALYRLAHGTQKIEAVALPPAGSVSLRFVDSRQEGVMLNIAGWTLAGKDIEYIPPRAAAASSEGTVRELKLAPAGAYDAPTNIESREVTFKSHDGVAVPMSIVSRKGLKLDGSNPAILYGYGAYGIVESPAFGPRLLAWLELGGIYAYAHVRGGGVYGQAWHEAGKKTTKPNTWKDAIAAGEWLVANGYTSPARLGIYGGSAGGILVGRAITERPDLFAAAVPSVGSMDRVRSELTANGRANIPEFGTATLEGEFRALLAMSSYHALRDGTPYPAVMLTHGVNDIRVDVWQSTKFAARLAAASSSKKPVLLRLDYEAGHGQGASREQAQERIADIWSFMLWQFGMPVFQPAP